MQMYAMVVSVYLVFETQWSFVTFKFGQLVCWFLDGSGSFWRISLRCYNNNLCINVFSWIIITNWYKIVNSENCIFNKGEYHYVQDEQNIVVAEVHTLNNGTRLCLSTRSRSNILWIICLECSEEGDGCTLLLRRDLILICTE